MKTITRVTESISKGTKIMEYKPKDLDFLLVHDGKRILARHGPEGITGSGNSDAVFVVGTEKEIDAEIINLGLNNNDLRIYQQRNPLSQRPHELIQGLAAD